MSQMSQRQLEEMRKRQQNKKPREWETIAISLCFIIPCVFNFAYSTGIWDIKVIEGDMVPDGIDEFVKFMSIFVPITGLAMYHMLVARLSGE